MFRTIFFLHTNDADYCYVLAYSWTPDFCTENHFPGCVKPKPYWLKNFTLHGLWPQSKDSTGYPSFCTKEPYDPSAAERVGISKMTEYWPNVKYPEGDKNYGSFWEHEWAKHGTCTGLSQEEYFGAAVDLIIRFGTPAIISDAVGGYLHADQLRDAMGGRDMASLECEGEKKDILSGAFTCWTQINDSPGTQIVCPDEVLKEDTCAADRILIRKM